MRFLTARSSVIALIAGLSCSSGALAGPDWTEVGDAGSFLLSAQAPTGTPGSALNTISGSLSLGFLVPDFEDVYFIKILNPATFTVEITNANFNAQLFLFNITVPNQAYGLLGNDDRSASDNRPRILSPSTDGTGVVIPAAGDYLLAVSGFNNDPRSITGPIFNQASVTEISGADGVGGLNPLTQWTGAGEVGNYLITLTGAGRPTLPSPSGVAALGLGLLAAARRRRA